MNKQDDLHDDLDPKLQKLYRQLPKEQPSKELDAKILAAAKITAAGKSTPKHTHSWQAPFALAASVIMVSSVALYLHEENPAVFEVQTKSEAPSTSMPMSPANGIAESTPQAEMTKPAVNEEAELTDTANTKQLTDNKVAIQKSKNAAIAEPQEAITTSADTSNDHQLTALTEKKADIASRADKMAETTLANKSAKLVQSAIVAKELESRQAKAETDHFTAAAPAPAPTVSPMPQMQPRSEAAERRSMQASRFQDANRLDQQLSAVSTESAQPTVLEKSNDALIGAAAPMTAAPMSAGSLAGAAMPMAKQRAQSDESTSANYTKNISAPVLSIEGVAMGMNREQLVAQALTCYVDVCHLDISQPQQTTYWGMPAKNAHLTAFLSHHVVTKLVLQQKNAQLSHVKTALSNVGIASQQSCIEEKGKLLISKQLGANYFNVRSMGVGLSLAICQQTKP